MKAMPDAITKTLFENFALNFGNFAGFTAAQNGSHTIFDPTTVRVKMTAGGVVAVGGVMPGTRPVTITKDAAGDTIYLSYFTNEISSVLLSDPPLAGVTKVTTDNLSGCKVFVDKVGATNNLIFYHANRRADSPPSNQGAVRPALETANAATNLDNLHTAAMAHYAAAPHNLAGVVNVGSINKPTYNQQADAMVVRKTNQGRVRLPGPNDPPDPNRVNAPEWAGGTVVFGFYMAHSGWEIYYQTWGAVEYRRPKTAVHAVRTYGRDEPLSGFRLVQFGRIYPHPFDRPV